MSSDTTAKVFLSQLSACVQLDGNTKVNGKSISRVWIQGIVVWLTSESEECVVDDGSGLILIDLRHFRSIKPSDNAYKISLGEYWMFIGPLRPLTSEQIRLKDVMRMENRILAHQVINLNAMSQQRESLWFLEVIEYWRNII
uniref:Uncharacterized protein AlNc14C442G11683 n=1 Tax=Albugo laibachii Nc14 TaxID=890382 RepID=F0WZU2_9STRA|nr:conserved hypothetical protein [Albugo laibachii Nc14]|eukprot:CCA27019.1 conserved hypothetical protein [Albugo laibachii Nc14]